MPAEPLTVACLCAAWCRTCDAYREVFDHQMEEARLRGMLERIARGRIVITFPERLTPFSFPVKVDSMRENLSSEKLEDRVRRMQEQLEKK